MPKLNLGFLVSHGGSNMQAILDSIKDGRLNASPCVVISNNSTSYAIERAKSEGIPFYHLSSKTHPAPDELDKIILKTLVEHNVNIVVLAGYMKKIGPEVLNHYNGKILNIHPALLPKYGGPGMYGNFVHEAVIAAGDKTTGPTVHVVNEDYDKGRILAQAKVPVLPDDTPDTLAVRVLEQEHKIYSVVLQKIAEGIIRL